MRQAQEKEFHSFDQGSAVLPVLAGDHRQRTATGHRAAASRARAFRTGCPPGRRARPA
ncbi:hypothetical protein H1235_15055 [Pseudoxanthomonas sp. NC8]|nr:hypothetical protein H1235_15055 [Pseudoxanthomonas sp. NC8]